MAQPPAAAVRAALALPLALAALVACEATDPFLAEGRWRPAGANEANLRAMVADPAHLERGQAAVRTDAAAAAAAVDRLRRDKVRPLPGATGTSRVGAASGGG